MTAGRASQIHRGRAIKVFWKGFMEQPLQLTEGVDFDLEVAHGVWTIGGLRSTGASRVALGLPCKIPIKEEWIGYCTATLHDAGGYLLMC